MMLVEDLPIVGYGEEKINELQLSSLIGEEEAANLLNGNYSWIIKRYLLHGQYVWISIKRKESEIIIEHFI